MNLKGLSVFLFFLLCCSILKADYTRLRLTQVIEMTDIAFVGRIINVDIEKYTLEIDTILYGDYAEKTISIVKFINWKDHHRWKNYELGQREIVLTKKSNHCGYPYEYVSIGAGNEGEIEILENSAVLLDRFGRESKFDVLTLCCAIKDYHANYKEINEFFENELVKFEEPNYKQKIDTALITNTLITKFEDKSFIHKSLINFKRKTFKEIVLSSGGHAYKKIEIETDVTGQLFKNFENRILINVKAYLLDSLNLISQECVTTRKGNELYVKPIKGKKTRLFVTYKSNNQIDTITYYDLQIKKHQLPTVDLSNCQWFWCTGTKEPLVVVYGNSSNVSKFYEVMGFSMDIITKQKTITLNSVSSRITNEMFDLLYKPSTIDHIIVYNIIVCNKECKTIELKPQKSKL